MKVLFRLVRRLAESACTLLVAALFLAPLALCAPRDARAKTLRRWRHFAIHGWRMFRESWWDAIQLEPAGTVLRHFLWLEWFDLGAARALPRGPSTPRGGIERVLVVSLGHIGDLLHTMPAIRSLRRQRPKARIDLLVGTWNEELARTVGEVDAVITFCPSMLMFNRGKRNRARGECSLRDLRQGNYDILFSASNTSMPDLMIWLASGARTIAGVVPPAAASYNVGEVHPFPYDTSLYEAERIARLLAAVGLDPGSCELAMAHTPSPPQAWRDLPPGRPRVVIAPGAGWPGKAWPAERFGDAAARLAERYGAGILLVGSPAEAALAEKVQARAGTGAVDVVGKTSLGELAAVIASADLFIGNDSGPLHMAAAFDTATVALFGPTRAAQWAPRGPRHIHIQRAGLCGGCCAWHPRGRCLHDGRCMLGIAVDEVVLAAGALLEGAMKGRRTA